MKRLLKFRAGYGSQVLIYDPAKIEELISFSFTEDTYSLGFAAVDGGITFFLDADDGLADFSIYEGGPDSIESYDKTIEGQVLFATGEVCIADPGEPGLILSIPPGEYKITFAYKKTDVESFLEIDVFLELQ